MFKIGDIIKVKGAEIYEGKFVIMKIFRDIDDENHRLLELRWIEPGSKMPRSALVEEGGFELVKEATHE